MGLKGITSVRNGLKIMSGKDVKPVTQVDSVVLCVGGVFGFSAARSNQRPGRRIPWS